MYISVNYALNFNLSAAVRLLFFLSAFMSCLYATEKGWKMHTIDNTSFGADGVKVADLNGDGREDFLVGWEQGKVVRLYIQPKKVDMKWPYIEFSCPNVEDAFFADVNADSVLDVVCCCEGETKQIVIFKAPILKEKLMQIKQWKREAVEVTSGYLWVQGVALEGPQCELILGAKGKKNPGIYSLKKQSNATWKLKKIAECGWPMSVDLVDIDADGVKDVLTSSGSNPGAGIYSHSRAHGSWKSEKLSKGDIGYGFLCHTKTKQGIQIFAPSRFKGLCSIVKRGKTLEQEMIPYPPKCGKGKASACADLDGDGQIEVVVNFGAADNKQGLIYFKKTKAGWNSSNVCGLKGNKFDNIILRDMDNDGDLDIITCEENRNSSTVPGLGLIWYENPAR